MFYPTFGRKLGSFCPNLCFLPHIWTKTQKSSPENLCNASVKHLSSLSPRASIICRMIWLIKPGLSPVEETVIGQSFIALGGYLESLLGSVLLVKSAAGYDGLRCSAHKKRALVLEHPRTKQGGYRGVFTKTP